MYMKPQIYLHDISKNNTRGEKSSEGVTLNVKWEEKEQILGDKDHKHEDMGRIPKESYPFPLMSKGERNIR
jgi:hypothetical protein